MPDGLIVITFIAFFGLVVAFGIYAYHQNQKRLAALREWANSRQFTFDEAHDSTFEDRFAEFECFREGKKRYAYNILEGTYRNFPVTAFEYHNETYSKDKDGKEQTHHHYFSAVIIETGLPLKPLWIRPENIFDKVGEFMGFDDIDFESAEFSRKFHVSSPDRRWAFDILHQKAMEFLLAAPRLSLEMQTQRILVRGSGCFDADDYQAALDTAVGLMEMLPDSVRREMHEGR